MSSTDNNDKWILGVTLGLLGSIAINTGNNVQSLGLKNLKEGKSYDSGIEIKKSFLPDFRRQRRKTAPSDLQVTCNEISVKGKDLNKESKAHPCSSMTWMIGTIIFVSGSLLNFASYAFAAQSMLASLESIQFVTNLIFGKFMLKANVTKTMLIGTGLTVMGTILAVQFSSRATLNLGTDDIKELYANPAYLIYLVLLVAMLFLLSYVYKFYEKSKTSGNPLRFSGAVIPLSYSIWSALFGTQSVVQAKVLAELLSEHSSGEENIFQSWFTYATIIAWILTVAVWLSRLNYALSKFDPLLIIPLLQCSFIFFAIISGGIFFKEFNEFTLTQWIGFWGGVLVMFSGLILLTPVNRKVDEEQLSKDIATLLRSKAETISPFESTQDCKNKPDIGNMKPQTKRDFLPKCSDEPKLSQSLSIMMTEDETAKSNSIKRSPRQSLSQAVTQMSVMRDVVIESANMFLTPPTGTNALTDAMLDSTEQKQDNFNRIEKLKLLQSLLYNKEHGETREMILSRKVLELVYNLGLEESVTNHGVHPMMQELDKLRDELGSPRTFRNSILKKASEMEKNLTKPLECDTIT